MSYKIGSFNLQEFSLKKKDFNKLASIIADEDFDIIAIQELLAPSALKYLTDVLNKNRKFDQKWESCFGDSKSRNILKNEYPAFIWNSKRIELIKTGYKENPMSIDNFQIKNIPGQIKLLRNPVIARFKPVKREFEIRLINVHIRYSKGNLDSEVMDGQGKMRLNEFDLLTKKVLPKFTDQVSPLNTKTAYTFLLGDYNICLKRPGDGYIFPYIPEDDIVFAEERNGRTRKILTVQEDLSTLKRPKEGEDIPENIFCNNYDHFSLDEEKAGHVVASNAVRIDTVSKYYNKELTKYRDEISDHVPIVMEINA